MAEKSEVGKEECQRGGCHRVGCCCGHLGLRFTWGLRGTVENTTQNCPSMGLESWGVSPPNSSLNWLILHPPYFQKALCTG